MKRVAMTLLAVLALAWLASLATAQPPRGPRGPLPQDGEGPPGFMPGQDGPGWQFRPPLHPLMMALDADADGELSAEEVSNAPAALKKLDKNADGKLSREELRPQGVPPRMGFGGPPGARADFSPPGGRPGGPGREPEGGPAGAEPREGGPGPGGPSEDGPPGPGGEFHLLPRFEMEQLNLNPAQLQQVAELEKETKAKLDSILTPEQQKIFEEARPPRVDEGGPGGLMEAKSKPSDAPGRRPAGKPGKPGGDQGPSRPQRPLRPAG